LAIVKELVTALGGQVRLKSQLGVGSTFTITLPEKIEA
jgi:two-component system phosphate regulon sensor histidine kinase PhoR